MPPRYPIRPHNHVIATQSERYFERHLPPQWTTRPAINDYGVDLYVDIFEGRNATPLEFLVQLKASQIASPRDMETITLKVSTYNYLWNRLQVVLLVKYCEQTDEAYWLLLKDVPPPDQTKKTFTIHVPKVNSLSTIDWNVIKTHVEYISWGKLELWRQRNG